MSGVGRKGTAFRNLLRNYLQDAKSHGRLFRLSKKRFKLLTSLPCFFCGRNPSNIKKSTAGEKYVYNGVDRWNSNAGYTVDNCVTCCFPCNRAKGTLSGEEFINLCRTIVNHTAQNLGHNGPKAIN